MHSPGARPAGSGRSTSRSAGAPTPTSRSATASAPRRPVSSSPSIGPPSTPVLPVLSEREREVIRLRFVDDMTRSQIAERIGHSQMHVSRILRGALARLHEEVAGESEVESDAKRVLPS